MKQISRVCLGVLLLPLCYGVLQAMLLLAHAFRQAPEGSYYFILGFLGYYVFQWVFFRPIRTYVFGHELTHALAAWMSGGGIKHFHVSKKGGSVTVTKSNLWVALAPYIVPIYSFLLLGLFFGAGFFYDLAGYWRIFLGLLGATLGFHAALTGFALKQNQPDLKAGGKFLSGILIFIGNALFLVLLLKVLFPATVSGTSFALASGRETLAVYRGLGRQVETLIKRETL